MADGPISDFAALLKHLEPVLHPGVVVYSVLPDAMDLEAVPAIGMFREAEGTTVILTEADAAAHGLRALFRAAWITLNVHSDLNAIGLTAAVASALSDAGISCNVVAGAYHDHLFVPADAGQRAVQVLQRLGRGTHVG